MMTMLWNSRWFIFDIKETPCVDWPTQPPPQLSPQVGLPPIQDDIEAAWLEGKGELTEEQVGNRWIGIQTDKLTDLKYLKLLGSTQRLFWTPSSQKVAAIIGWEMAVTPDQGGDLAQQVEMTWRCEARRCFGGFGFSFFWIVAAVVSREKKNTVV